MTTTASIPAGLQVGAPTPPEDGRGPAVVSRALAAVPPPGLVLLAIVSIQVGATLAIKLFPMLGASGTVFLRVALSALLLAVFVRPAIDGLVRRHAGLLLLYGAVLAATNLLFYESIARIPLGIAVTIEFLGPLALAVATSRRAVDFLWVGLAAFGIALLAPDIGAGLDPLGVAFACLAGVGWASFILLTRRLGQVFEGNRGLCLGMIVAAFCLLPFGIVESAPVLTSPLLALAVLLVAILSTTIPFTLEFQALKRMPPRTYGVLVTLEPAVAVMIAALLLGQSVGFQALIAVACVTLAAIGSTLFGRGGSH